MDGISTLTQKGQIVIPKPIRDFFNLKAFDRLYFAVSNNKIVAKPIISINEVYGMVKAAKKVSKAEYKRTIRRRVINKFRQ